MGFSPVKRLCLLALIVLVAGCSLTPRQTAQRYLEALSTANFSLASSLVVPEKRGAFTDLERLYRTLELSQKVKFRIQDWQILDCRELADQAVVDFRFGQDQQGQLRLLKIQNEWKIDSRPMF